jgi:hypothetical protein
MGRRVTILDGCKVTAGGGRAVPRGIIALLGFTVMLGGTPPAMTAPLTGTIEDAAPVRRHHPRLTIRHRQRPAPHRSSSRK